MRMLYITLSKKETRLAWCVAAGYIALCLGISRLPTSLFFLFGLAAAAGVATVFFLFRRFWQETWQGLGFTGKNLLWKPLLAALLSNVLCTVINDLFMFYGIGYFTMTGFGPLLWDIRSVMLAKLWSSPYLPAFVVIFLVPVVEEFFFRGVIFGSLYSKNSVLAVILSTLLFAAFRTFLFTGVFCEAEYLSLYFLQFIPRSLFACWLYTSTDSLAAPILMHMICNTVLIFFTY